MAKVLTKSPACHCAAYKFPHRARGGQCTVSPAQAGQKLEELCECCLLPADGRDEDFGIGGYEFWGDRGTHHDWQFVSNCCEAGFVENSAKGVKDV